jgi:hypothetical protein
MRQNGTMIEGSGSVANSYKNAKWHLIVSTNVPSRQQSIRVVCGPFEYTDSRKMLGVRTQM